MYMYWSKWSQYHGAITDVVHNLLRYMSRTLMNASQLDIVIKQAKGSYLRPTIIATCNKEGFIYWVILPIRMSHVRDFFRALWVQPAIWWRIYLRAHGFLPDRPACCWCRATLRHLTSARRSSSRRRHRRWGRSAVASCANRASPQRRHCNHTSVRRARWRGWRRHSYAATVACLFCKINETHMLDTW